MKNNKGFTLVEMLVSFTLSMILIIILFQLIINLKDLYMSSGIKTELLNRQYLMTNRIYTDLNEKKAIKIENCNNPVVCIEFTFQDGSTKRLEVDETNKTLSYDGYIIKLDNNSYFKTMDISTIISQSNKKIFNANIPIYNDLYKNTDFGINIVYPYNDQEITNNYGNKYVAPIDSYISLPYIKSTGTQYINTGIIATENTGFEIKFKTNNDLNNTTYGSIFGARESSAKNELQLSTYSPSSSIKGVLRYGTGGEYNADMEDISSIQQISLKNKVYTGNSGTTRQLSGTFTTPVPITVFALNQNGTITQYGSLELYYLKIYEGDNLVMNLTPAKSRETNKIGLYDTVGKQFFISNGTSDFIYE